MSGLGHLKTLLPNIQRIDVIPECGHATHWDKPDELTKRLLAFIKNEDKKEEWVYHGSSHIIIIIHSFCYWIEEFLTRQLNEQFMQNNTGFFFTHFHRFLQPIKFLSFLL